MKRNKLIFNLALICTLLGFSLLQAQCPYVPIYSSGNLVSDPECNNYPNNSDGWSKNWGNGALISDANAYCGTSIQVTGNCGGSIDYILTGKLLANTAYRFRAMMFTNASASITLNGFGINGSTADYQKSINTGSTWQLVDFIFTTGTLASSQNFWFNSCGNSASDIRIDNFECHSKINCKQIIINSNIYRICSRYHISA